MAKVRDADTNLVARDWRGLAEFYVSVFGCEPVGPERDLAGDWLEHLTDVPGARLQACTCGSLGTAVPGPPSRSSATTSPWRR